MALTDLNIAVKEMAVGYGHYLAIGTDGSLYSWGLNSNGQLGHGDTNNRSNPTKIGTDTDWTQVACGDYHSVALKSNGVVYGFGKSSDGQLGAYKGNLTGSTPNTRPPNPRTDEDFLEPEIVFRSAISRSSSTLDGPANLIKAGANYSIVRFTDNTDIGDRYSLGTRYYGAANWGYPGKTSTNITVENHRNYAIAHHVTRSVQGETPYNRNYDTPVLEKIDLIATGRYTVAATSPNKPGILLLGRQPYAMTLYDGTARNPLNGTKTGSRISDAFIPTFNWTRGTGPSSLQTARGTGDPYVPDVQNYMNIESNLWHRVRTKTPSERNPIGEIDTRRYISIGIGDDFLLAIDDRNNLYGMTFAVGVDQIQPTSVGHFGVEPYSFQGRGYYVVNGLELLDSSKVWVNVSCGADHAIISDADGAAYSIGDNRYFQLGRGERGKNYPHRGNTFGTTLTRIGNLNAGQEESFKIHVCGPQASLIAKS